ncbi:MAG: N-6 DNA methylase, partial [Candidatus Hydrogenedentota bacterium]
SVLIHHMLSQLWDMIEEIKPEDRNVFEPACGHAPFLTGAMRWLRSWEQDGQSRTTHDYLCSHLHGLEADPFAIELAKLALTLADEPYGNSWRLTKGDMFMPGVLAKQAKKTHILLSNPPYEAFTTAQRTRYAKEGEAVTANTKATEMLLRTLSHLPLGGVFGVVMPLGALYDKESKPVRERLRADFDLSEILEFADNLFEHSDHEAAVLIGRRKTSRTKPIVLHYRRVREQGMEAFKDRLAFSWEQEMLPSSFLESVDTILRVPELGEVWAHLSKRPILDSVALVAQGLSHKGKSLPNGCWTVRDKSSTAGVLGFANVDSALNIFGLPKLVKLNLEPRAVLSYRNGRPTGQPQVLLNYARVAREPWKLKATLDDRGHALTSRFSALRPKPDGPSVLFLWAIMNSPVANAFAYCHLAGRDILVGTMRTMPFPMRWYAHAASIEQAALRYRQLATSEGPLFDGLTTPDSLKQALLAMDAAVLRAYDLPPRLERQLLDLFVEVERKGVGCDFRGYYPPGFTSYLPLHMLISDRFQRAAADTTADRFKPGESAYVRDVLSVAAAGAREK